jgi:HNH endonuclease
MFEALVDELRTHPTEWLRREREELIVEQRNLRTRELAVLRVLDERGQVDCSLGAHGESARTVRDKVETARELESLPAIASVAMEGGLSDEQLSSVVKVADVASDREWAYRAPNTDPIELERMARKASKPTAADSRARHAARELKMWWNRERTMLSLRGQLPDAMGAEFEQTVQALTEQMKVQGEPWRPFEQRAADALLVLCESGDDDAPSLAGLAGLQIAVPLDGPAEIAGVPIADSLLEQLRANASITPVLVGDDGEVVAIGRAAPALSSKVRRAVLARDARCRVPGCGRRRGLEVHHLVPRSWSGSDDISNLVAVCPAHHRLLVPHGLLALVGNPNLPDGLELVTAGRGPPEPGG